MAILGLGAYLCEACRFFDADGIDGNHPECDRQGGVLHGLAVRVGEECPFGFKPGVPSGYPCTDERRKERAVEVASMLGIELEAE